MPASVRPAGESPVVRRPSSALLQRRLRDVHLYLGMLFAPALLFFALTGALQLYDLHENKPGQSFEPPQLFQELGMVHKKQRFALPRQRAPAPAPAEAGDAATPAPQPAAGGPRAGWAVQVLKGFFLLTALGLVASTALGIWIALRSGRNRGLALALLIAGAAVPALLLAF